MELIHNLCDLETLSGAGDHHEIMGFTDDHHPHRRQAQPPMNFTQHHDHDVLVAHPTALTGDQFGHETDKEKGLGGRKRKRNSEKDVQKLKEVIHVRAKRGQATDSHSLAERVRREKINERLRCLQNLVPGCYKTMGMAVMLDVVISYVQSLQNQIEFLSLKLSAASVYYDFNSPGLDAVDTMQQQGTNMNAGYNDQVQEEEGYGGGGLPTADYNNSTWPV